MKKAAFLILIFFYSINLKAWWDAGHLVTAMIAYLNLDEDVRKKVDDLTAVLQRDYDHVSHFIATGPWPDDLKAEGVRSYDTWHYTNIPYNYSKTAIPQQAEPEIDVIWAIDNCYKVLNSSRPRDIEKARHLAFLVHLVADIHQPLHSTSMYTNELPGGTVGGNAFGLSGKWPNLHQLWDDGCGYLSDYNDINPYGQKKDELTTEEIDRLKKLAEEIINDFPKESIVGLELTDPDFWALESHKAAIKYGYRGVNSLNDKGRFVFIQPGDEPSEKYLEASQKVVQERLAAGGYRLANMLNKIFADD